MLSNEAMVFEENSVLVPKTWKDVIKYIYDLQENYNCASSEL